MLPSLLPTILTWQFSQPWLWPCTGDGLVSLWGAVLAPDFDQWSLDWGWHSTFTGKWLESSLDCVAQNRFNLGWWDWAGSARPSWFPSCLNTCLCGPDWAKLWGLGLADVYFNQNGPHRTVRGSEQRGDKLSSTAVLTQRHGSCLSVGNPTGHPLSQDLYLSSSGNRVTTHFHGSPTGKVTLGS